jgi:hypothetical protein
MLKVLLIISEKILWFLFVVSIIGTIVLVVWLFVNEHTIPLWFPLSLGSCIIPFAIYYIIKKKRNE